MPLPSSTLLPSGATLPGGANVTITGVVPFLEASGSIATTAGG